MLRSNLSTRPFYNERAVHLIAAAAAIVVLALTAWNVVRIVSLSRHSTELNARVNLERSEAERLMAQAGTIRKTIDNDELEVIVSAAREANTLIDQRTFSWTAFFNRIESTIPPDVMLTSVHPSIRDEQTSVTMLILGRRAEDIDEFMEKLEATGAFEDVVPAQQDRTEQGLYRATIASVYTPALADETPAETDAPPSTPSTTDPNAPPPAPAPGPQRGAAPAPGPQRGGRQ